MFRSHRVSILIAVLGGAPLALACASAGPPAADAAQHSTPGGSTASAPAEAPGQNDAKHDPANTQSRTGRTKRASDGVDNSQTEQDLQTIETLRYAQQQYREFLARTSDGSTAHAEAKVRAKERIADLESTIAFLEQGIAQRRLEARTAQP